MDLLLELDTPETPSTEYSFETVEDVKKAFLQRKFVKVPADIVIAGIHYRRTSFSKYSLEDYLRGYTAMVVFTTPTGKPKFGSTVEPTPEITAQRQQKAAAMANAELNALVVFGWNFLPGLTMVPIDVKTTTEGRLHNFESNKNKPNVVEGIGVNDDQLIGTQLTVRISNLPNSKPIPAKVDTGATMCSLHADKWEINRTNKTVSFINKHISPNIITLPLVDQQPVSSADGGTEYRPVVELNVVIGNKQLQQIQFNLNDRSGMQDQMLIGQNALQKGKFLIDPQKTTEGEEFDWDVLNQLFESSKPQELSREQKIQNAYEAMLNSDVTLEELMRYIKTETIKTYEKITY